MAYFPDRSKESAGKLLAREIHTNLPLMSALSKTAGQFHLFNTMERNGQEHGDWSAGYVRWFPIL